MRLSECKEDEAAEVARSLGPAGGESSPRTSARHELVSGSEEASIVYWRTNRVPGKYHLCERTFLIVFTCIVLVGLTTFCVMTFNPKI